MEPTVKREARSLSAMFLLVTVAALLVRVSRMPRTLQIEPLSTFKSSVNDPYAVVFVQLDWTPLEWQRERFQEFANAYFKLDPFHGSSFRIINFTKVSNGYAPLARLPGWQKHDPGPRSHQINGCGEIIWLKKGQIVRIVRLDEVAAVEQLLELTRQSFPDLF